MENVLTKENALRIMNSVNDKKIDIRKTIEKTQTASDFGLLHLYCVPLDHYDKTRKTFPEIMGMNFMDYEDYVDEAYYERVMEHLEEGNGIYITLAYVCNGIPSDDDKIFEYKLEGFNYEVEEEEDDSYDDHAFYIRYFVISSAGDDVYLKHHDFDELGCDDTSNYGISIKKVNGEYVYRWGNHGGAGCMSPPFFDEFEDNDDFDGFCDLANPVNQLVLAVMENCIVFE